MNPARLTLSLAALGLLAGCGRRESAVAVAASLPPARVHVAAVHLEEVPLLVEVAGTVRPVQRATLAAKVMGAIEELPVVLGQRVKAGDLLVKISAGEISARVLQAQAQLNQARRDLDRERYLLAKGASTPDMVKSLEDRFAMTGAMVREAEVMLGYATVRAPFDGVVARKLANAGDLAAPGQPLLEVEGTGDFQVDVPAAGISFTGTLVEVSSAADGFTRTVLAKISVPAGTSVGSGQYARVQAPGAPVRALLAPAAAVSQVGQLERVFVARDGRAVLRLVKTGATRGDRVEILSGLADGDPVVVNPPVGLREGQPLAPTPSGLEIKR
jgi:multidrug efflux pump subunit AcrA (membrane-fusion protein)